MFCLRHLCKSRRQIYNMPKAKKHKAAESFLPPNLDLGMRNYYHSRVSLTYSRLGFFCMHSLSNNLTSPQENLFHRVSSASGCLGGYTSIIATYYFNSSLRRFTCKKISNSFICVIRWVLFSDPM